MKRPNRTSSLGWMKSVVADGTIWCPLRGDSDVERCFRCQYLENAEQHGDTRIISCRPRRGRVLDLELLAGLRT